MALNSMAVAKKVRGRLPRNGKWQMAHGAWQMKKRRRIVDGGRAKADKESEGGNR
jgi:hypothetical protein